ncbi:DNA polymerase/3'-5' exonuclease PolX [Candidatus Peregrinibacteria bacterium]|nr:DNA polymerase/3'-5' exonuclease PolX [Candidatus Peregrinibacteria bacterium]
MTNAEIAQVFERIAMLLELTGEENPFRIRAYERAVQVIGNLPKDIREIYDHGGIGSLKELPGVGEDLAQKIEELLKTDKLSYLNKLEKNLPKGLLEIMRIEGIGPKKTKFLWQKFNVRSISQLKRLAESGKLTSLKGWGEKSVANILKGIEFLKTVSGRLPIYEALPFAQELIMSLKKTNLCSSIEIAGSLRRHRETCRDIDILATSNTPAKLMDSFCALPHVARVVAKGTTKASVFLHAGIDADLRIVAPDVFGAALYYFTGSKDHNVHVRKIAVRRGLTVSEYGVFKGTAKHKGELIAAKTEKDVFAALDLPYIEPELREDRGEIEAATAGRLPHLIQEKYLRGDLHTHSTFSDGRSSIIEMARAAKEKGHEYVAITDHASSMGMVRGIKPKNIKKYLREIHKARLAVPGIHILAGAEVDILADGSLYLPDSVLAKLDLVVASIHQNFRQSRVQLTKRVLRAIENPYVHILGHPTGRIIGKREAVDLDIDAVLRAAKKNGKVIELNASPVRLDLNDVHLKRAKELGVTICINSDAHSPAHLSYQYGIFQARRGWLEKKDVLNTLPWERLHNWLKKR